MVHDTTRTLWLALIDGRSQLGKITAALAALARASYLDAEPHEDTREEWRALVVDAQREATDLRATLARRTELAADLVVAPLCPSDDWTNGAPCAPDAGAPCRRCEVERALQAELGAAHVNAARARAKEAT